MNDRIKQARQRMGLSKSALSRLLGVTPTSCISWELPEDDRNAASPNVDNLTRLAVVFNVRLDWLVNGQGAMTYTDDSADSGAEPDPRAGLLPSDQQELVDLYGRLAADKRTAVMELLKGLQSVDD
jgi:transcriptional regulator with XRE-family HTH domain